MRRPIEVVELLIGAAIGVAIGACCMSWNDAVDRAQAEAERMKVEFVESAGIFKLHNEIAQKVGPRVWKDEVRPEYLGRVTWAAAYDQGTLFPDVLTWVKGHPKEAQELLKSSVHEERRNHGEW